MKLRFIPLAAAIPLLAISACNGGNSDSDKTDADTLISNFTLKETIKTASQSYHITDEATDFSCYLTISTSIQWPEEISDYEIGPLQDSIISIAYPQAKKHQIDAAIIEFICDTESYGLGNNAQPVDTVPQSTDYNYNYDASVDMQLLECTELSVTYGINYSQYLGGAHPNGGSTSLTYIFSDASIVNIPWLFKDGYHTDLEALLMQAVAAQAGISIDELKDSMLTPTFPISNNVYILGGNIVFHYNPYEVLPHSFGQIDATIPPYEIRDLLTQQAIDLLL